MAHLTIRNLPDELMERLRALKRESGVSINQLVVRTLMKAFSVDPERRDLSRYTTWTEEEHQEFSAALKEQRTIDPELWE